MIPRATYRLQFHAGFTFADAEAIVPYLADLGISHVYASPITVAAPGSTHGYDVIDPTRVNPELGGEEGLVSLVAALKARDMGMIIDIVPNHMGVAGDSNPYWLDVLAKGPASEHARLFDIDWGTDGRGQVVLPVLGAPLEEAIAAGDVEVVPAEQGLALRLYGETTYPLRREDHGFDLGQVGDPQALWALIERQHYRLVYWRLGNDCLNWRRFFSINELAGVRVEDEAVFAFTHSLYFDLFHRGLIDGVRVDHIDGLADPAAYCRRLRAGFAAVAPARSAYIVVEKILAADEALPEWPVDGTSGYDFMREVSGLLHDPQGVTPLSALWVQISGRPADFAIEAEAARRDILSWQFEGQLAACVASFEALAASAGIEAITGAMLRRALERLLWAFPVYRTYGTGGHAPASDDGVRAAARAAMSAPPGEGWIADRVLEWLAGAGNGDAALKADAVRRFQQLSAPIAAKGVEDTAFYRHGVLLSANDVGFDPGRMAMGLDEFHQAMSRRAATQPGAMLATATHDHKRGEDARARLAVLSAVPHAWESAVTKWFEIARPHAEGVAPDNLYILFQALVGAWDEGRDSLPRIHDWQRKALREAKLRSFWEEPDEAYEQRCADCAAALLGSREFRAAFEDFMGRIAGAAEANSLAQAALHYLLPGVPDLYQGCELPDYSMVDPDNRRQVDYTRRIVALSSGAQTGAAAKFRLIAQLLDWRRSHLALREGDYAPLQVTGARAGHVVAFARSAEGQRVCAAVAVRLGGVLYDTLASYPDAAWWGETNISDGERCWRASEIFGEGVVKLWRA